LAILTRGGDVERFCAAGLDRLDIFFQRRRIDTGVGSAIRLQ